MVILNSMNDSNATFGFDTNKITIIKNDFSQKDFPLKSKTEVASDIVREIGRIISDDDHYLNESVFEYETMYR